MGSLVISHSETTSPESLLSANVIFVTEESNLLAIIISDNFLNSSNEEITS